MPEPILTLVLIAAFFGGVALAHWFRTLDGSLWRDARVALFVGFLSGMAVRLFFEKPQPVALAILLTLAAIYVRLIGRESEPADGMTIGAMTGAAAAVPWFRHDGALLVLAGSVLAGAVAGYGITFGLTHVRDKVRQALIDAVTAAVAVGAAHLPLFVVRGRVTDRHVAIAAVSLVPLLILATVFKQWSAIRAELRDEVTLGVIDEPDVRPTAHPFLRLGRGGWHDAGAHREFVRIATKIALRKRQQRGRPDEVARLYQLEVIKLRMQAQEMSRIDRAMRAAAAAERSDTIREA